MYPQFAIDLDDNHAIVKQQQSKSVAKPTPTPRSQPKPQAEAPTVNNGLNKKTPKYKRGTIFNVDGKKKPIIIYGEPEWSDSGNQYIYPLQGTDRYGKIDLFRHTEAMIDNLIAKKKIQIEFIPTTQAPKLNDTKIPAPEAAKSTSRTVATQNLHKYKVGTEFEFTDGNITQTLIVVNTFINGDNVKGYQLKDKFNENKIFVWLEQDILNQLSKFKNSKIKEITAPKANDTKRPAPEAAKSTSRTVAAQKPQKNGLTPKQQAEQERLKTQNNKLTIDRDRLLSMVESQEDNLRKVIEAYRFTYGLGALPELKKANQILKAEISLLWAVYKSEAKALNYIRLRAKKALDPYQTKALAKKTEKVQKLVSEIKY